MCNSQKVKRQQEEGLIQSVVKVAGLLEESIVDGPGLRFVLFAQGCPHGCTGCHNPETHDMDSGTLWPTSKILEKYRSSGASGITLSGGEPFLQAEALSELAEAVKKLGGDVITYTGYQLADLKRMESVNSSVSRLLSNTDVLIDGPFMLSRRTLELPFVGSSNQNIIPLSNCGEKIADAVGRLNLNK